LLGAKTSPPVLTPRSIDLEADKSKELYIGADGAGVSHTPFLHSTKGKIIMLIAAIIIVGAIVGGAVGGTVGKNHDLPKDSFSGNGTTSNSESDTGPTGPTGPIASSTATTEAQATGSVNGSITSSRSHTNSNALPTIPSLSSTTSTDAGQNVSPTQGTSGNVLRRR
jgi:hypothetical protein